MITTSSFLNPGATETESIGRLYWDREEQVYSHKYLEVTQAEDYVLFRLVHESSEQRYAHDSFRKMIERRIPIADVVMIEEAIDRGPLVLSAEEQRTLTDYPSVEVFDQDGDVLALITTEDGFTIGGLNGRYSQRVRLSPEDAESLSWLLSRMRFAYDEMIEESEEITATALTWQIVARDLDNSALTDKITAALWGYGDRDLVTITLRSWEYHDVSPLLTGEVVANAAEWQAMLAELAHDREDEVIAEIEYETGVTATTLPYGTLPTTYLSATFSRSTIDAIHRSATRAYFARLGA